MEITIIFAILIIHWIADFILQTDSQAKGKSKKWKPLLTHTFNYSGVWFIVGLLYIIPTPSVILFWKVFTFFIITFVAHTITDYFTSRLNSRLWAQGRTHDFFVAVGFDQILHYVQLFLTYLLIFA